MKPEEYYRGISSIDGMLDRRPRNLTRAQVREAIDLGMEQDIVKTTRPLMVTRAVWALAYWLKGKAYAERERLIEDAEGKIQRREEIIANKVSEVDSLTTDLVFKVKALRSSRNLLKRVMKNLEKMEKTAKRRLWLAVISTGCLVAVAFWDDIYGYLAYIYRMVTG